LAETGFCQKKPRIASIRVVLICCPLCLVQRCLFRWTGMQASHNLFHM